jgi:hypothetical protein
VYSLCLCVSGLGRCGIVFQIRKETPSFPKTQVWRVSFPSWAVLPKEVCPSCPRWFPFLVTLPKADASSETLLEHPSIIIHRRTSKSGTGTLCSYHPSWYLCVKKLYGQHVSGRKQSSFCIRRAFRGTATCVRSPTPTTVAESSRL